MDKDELALLLKKHKLTYSAAIVSKLMQELVKQLQKRGVEGEDILDIMLELASEAVIEAG